MTNDRVFSMRLPTGLDADLRQVAARAGISVSDLMRAAARRLVDGRDVLDEPSSRIVGYKCPHFSIFSAAVIGAPSVPCECGMQPIYEVTG